MSKQQADSTGLEGREALNESTASSTSIARSTIDTVRVSLDETFEPQAQNKEGLPASIGPYRIIRKIGEGGMGTVYLGKDADDTLAAVKVPFHLQSGDEETVKRFEREARSAQQIVHPHICPVYGFGKDERHFYLAMAFVEGLSLAQWLEAGRDISREQALDWVQQLAGALQAAHDQGIVHRDLKPGNIMITPDRKAVLMDFGMARRFDNTESLLTPSGAIVGTPGYMAPEQITADAQAIGPACDIYSLGVLMYELLTGWAPFSGNLATLLGSIVSEPPTPPTKHDPDLPETLEQICLCALEKDPGDRFSSAIELSQAIDDYRSGDSSRIRFDSGKPQEVTASETSHAGFFGRIVSSVFRSKT